MFAHMSENDERKKVNVHCNSTTTSLEFIPDKRMRASPICVHKMEATGAAEKQLPWRQTAEGLLGLPHLLQ